MIITCPKCQTIYNLPDAKAKAGVKLRCSVCHNVFPLLDAKKQDNKLVLEETSTPKRYRVRNFFLFLVLAACAVAALWRYTDYLNPLKQKVQAYLPAMFEQEKKPDSASKLAEMVRLLEMRNVRQYSITNEKIGKLAVIEGKVANGFTEQRELIRLEAALFDAQGTPLVSKTQPAGTSVGLFQLQVLSQDELEQALNNTMDIMANNTKIAPGALVPFMFIFYNPPDNATDFSVKIIDASKPEV